MNAARGETRGVKMRAEAADNTTMERQRRRSSVWLWSFSAVMAAGAVALLFTSGAVHAAPFEPAVAVPWFVLALGFAIAAASSFEIRFRGEAHAFGLNEICLVLGLFVVAPSGLLAAQVLGCGLALWFVRRMPLLEMCLTVTQNVLATSVAVVVFRSVASPHEPRAGAAWFAAMLASMAFTVVALSATELVATRREGRRPAARVLERLGFGLAGDAVSTMLGLVVLIVLSESVAAAALLVGPVLVVFVAYRAYLAEHAQTQGLQFLYTASELLGTARDLEGGLLSLMNFARDTFAAELVEVVLRGEEGETVGYRTSVGPGDAMHRLEPAAKESVEAVVGLGSDTTSAVLVRVTADSPIAERDGMRLSCAMIATLHDDRGVRGAVLVAREYDSAAEPFGREELRLFETFANHLGTTMEKSRLSTSLAQLRMLKQELAHQAFHDSLTGLANRLKFRDLVDEALVAAARDGRKVAVLFIDLDDFKTVNDTMGHAAGDALLEEVARRIAANVGDDGTAARLGGDEFAVLLPHIRNDSQVRTVADDILVALGDPVIIDGQPVVAQASIGIASHVGAADAAELMRNADVAMYTAKRNGKGRFDEFEPTMSLTVARKHAVKEGLERALANDEFVLHYQPVINVATGAITGSEALVRWKDPQRGLMPPTEFVAVAEETGLIVPIGRYVLREACRQAAEWAAIVPGCRISVNLSTRQLADPDLVVDVSAALADARLAPQHLLLEVTETAMMHDVEEATATLQSLKQLGVSIAIDDFGTGYSSLSYLRQLPIDVVKIAKPIVDAICESNEDAAFVRGIIELGHLVGMTVIAEGVENVEQYAHLVDMHCDFVQGYYYAPSLEPEEFAALLGSAVPRPARRTAATPVPEPSPAAAR